MIPIGEFDNLEFRYNTFLECAKRESEYPDEGLPKMVLSAYASERDLSEHQKILLAYLYGMCYNPLTAIYLFEEYPFGRGQEEEDWWVEHKEILDFQQDKVKIKYMNQLVPSIRSFCENFDSVQATVLHLGFDDLKKAVIPVRYFGSHATYLMCDVLEVMFGKDLPCLPKKIYWNEHRLPSEGALHLIGYDEMIPLKEKSLSKETRDLLDVVLENILSTTSLGLLETESTLCAYRKLFKQTRYSGYYRDRHLENINNCKLSQHIIDFNLKVRRALIPEELLGEYSGWDGIRKDKCKEFKVYGKL